MTNSFPPDALLTAIGEIGYEWNLQEDRIEWCGAWQRLFGAGNQPPKNAMSFYAAIYPDDRYLVSGDGGENIDRRYRIRCPDGNIIDVQERAATESVGGHAVRQRGLIRVIERHRAFGAQELSGIDPLTGRGNRNHMIARLAHALSTGKGQKHRGAYLVIGIDKMSFVNDAVGTEAGNALLRGVADRLDELMPRRAMLARVGGDMYGILLTERLELEFEGLAERILQSFRDRPVMVTEHSSLHITVSIGGIHLGTIEGDAAEVMIRAEQALHDARARGRDVFMEYQVSAEREKENRTTLELGERIKFAFRNKGLKLAFQPVIASETGKTVFYEALVRMFRDNGEMIAAADFVPAVEKLGLAVELDKHVLDLAVHELEASPELCLSINISGITAAQLSWPDYMRRVLGDKPDVASRLIVEITETAAITDVKEMRRFVEVLRELGGQVALDDFGAGFTSVRHLRSLSLSIMKIDRDLLRDILQKAEQQHLVRMLIGIARGMGMKVVAEGVETAEVAAWLRQEQVDMLQGYYFGKPSLDKPWLNGKATLVSASEVKKLLAIHGADMAAPSDIRVVSIN